jgi:hypothetical protein
MDPESQIQLAIKLEDRGGDVKRSPESLGHSNSVLVLNSSVPAINTSSVSPMVAPQLPGKADSLSNTGEPIKWAIGAETPGSRLAFGKMGHDLKRLFVTVEFGLPDIFQGMQ